jgi:cytidylate kinase
MFITTAGVPRVEDDEATIVKVTERVIREAAAHGRVVLVGHGAQAVLAQRDSALHVFVVASRAWRIRQAIERLHLDPARAEKIVDETDHERDRYVKAYYGRQRGDPANYDFVVNAETLGFDGAANLIVTEVRRRRWA